MNFRIFSQTAWLALPAVFSAVAAQANADVIRVDFQTSTPFVGRPSVNFSGVEAQAAAANPIFGSNGSNTWNELAISPISTGVVNPSFSSLVNSAGQATNVGISFTGTIEAANDGAVNNVGSNAVENDYLVNAAVKVGYSITGLPANTALALYLYSPNFVLYDSPIATDQPSRGYYLTANGTLIAVDSGPDDNALAYVTTDSSGDISGTWYTSGNEGDWSGFQIAYPLATVPATTPEPATMSLAAGGMALVLIGLRRKRLATQSTASRR